MGMGVVPNDVVFIPEDFDARDWLLVTNEGGYAAGGGRSGDTRKENKLFV